jgi:hypothetical protein
VSDKTPIADDEIETRAYHLWEAVGSPEGRQDEFWEQARQGIITERKLASETKGEAPKTR